MTHDPSEIGRQCAAETRLRRVGSVVSHPYGSSVAAEDLRGWEPINEVVAIRINDDELLPVKCKSFVDAGEHSVWCEFRLIRYRGHIAEAEYEVSVSDDQP